jgi:hypothetical protein
VGGAALEVITLPWFSSEERPHAIRKNQAYVSDCLGVNQARWAALDAD